MALNVYIVNEINLLSFNKFVLKLLKIINIISKLLMVYTNDVCILNRIVEHIVYKGIYKQAGIIINLCL